METKNTEPSFDEWVHHNNPPQHLEYGKGFWDYIEILQGFVAKFEATDERLIGTYVVHTPPPTEELSMPAVAFNVCKVAFAIRYDFGSGSLWPLEWTVSLRHPAPYRGPLFGLFNASLDLSSSPIAGFGAEWTMPSYQVDQANFTCALRDEWDVATLIRIFAHE
jgi:hypothetical protein